MSTCITFKVLLFRQDLNIPHWSRLPFCAPYPTMPSVCAQAWFCQPRPTHPAAFLPRSLRAFLPLNNPAPAPRVFFSFPHTLCFLCSFAHAVLTACLDLSPLTVQWPYNLHLCAWASWGQISSLPFAFLSHNHHLTHNGCSINIFRMDKDISEQRTYTQKFQIRTSNASLNNHFPLENSSAKSCTLSID